MLFARFCRVHGVTRAERDELAWHLAMIRARSLYKLLRGIG